jgi:hypothetical protein
LTAVAPLLTIPQLIMLKNVKRAETAIVTPPVALTKLILEKVILPHAAVYVIAPVNITLFDPSNAYNPLNSKSVKPFKLSASGYVPGAIIIVHAAAGARVVAAITAFVILLYGLSMLPVPLADPFVTSTYIIPPRFL